MFIKEFKKGVSTEKLELHEVNNELLVYKYLKTDNKFKEPSMNLSLESAKELDRKGIIIFYYCNNHNNQS